MELNLTEQILIEEIKNIFTMSYNLMDEYFTKEKIDEINNERLKLMVFEKKVNDNGVEYIQFRFDDEVYDMLNEEEYGCYRTRKNLRELLNKYSYDYEMYSSSIYEIYRD